jgi:hypothetical protein
MAQAPKVQAAPAIAQHKKTRVARNRSAKASKANAKVPTMKPHCKAEVRLPTAVAGQPKACCKSGMTALTANHNEVPANWARTKTGKTWRGTAFMALTVNRATKKLPCNASPQRGVWMAGFADVHRV